MKRRCAASYLAVSMSLLVMLLLGALPVASARPAGPCGNSGCSLLSPDGAGSNSQSRDIADRQSEGFLLTSPIDIELPNRAPDAPYPIAPVDRETVSTNPGLYTSAFSDLDSGDTHSASDWQVTKIPGDYSSPVFNCSTDRFDLTGIVVQSSVLTAGTTYYWKVRYQDNHGKWSEWSEETSMTAQNTTFQPPQQPVNVSPSDSVTVDTGLTLIASRFAAADPNEWHTATQWQLTTIAGEYSNPAFDSGIDDSNETQLTLTHEILKYGTEYHWRVRYLDAHGIWSAYSTESSFRTVAATEEQQAEDLAQSIGDFFLEHYIPICIVLGILSVVGSVIGWISRQRRRVKLVDLVHRYEEKVKQFEREGYEVSEYRNRVKKAKDAKLRIAEVQRLENATERLKDVERELNDLGAVAGALAAEAQSIRRDLKRPQKVDEVEEALAELKEKMGQMGEAKRYDAAGHGQQ